MGADDAACWGKHSPGVAWGGRACGNESETCPIRGPAARNVIVWLCFSFGTNIVAKQKASFSIYLLKFKCAEGSTYYGCRDTSGTLQVHIWHSFLRGKTAGSVGLGTVALEGRTCTAIQFSSVAHAAGILTSSTTGSYSTTLHVLPTLGGQSIAATGTHAAPGRRKMKWATSCESWRRAGAYR